MSLLRVVGLKSHYRLRKGWVKAVDDVSFNLDRGENLGIVGESGCGKSTLALSIMRILPPNGRILDGQIIFKGVDLLKLSEDEMCKDISHNISVVFSTCDKIAVMYGGKIMEYADVGSIYKTPRHPYTIGLLKSVPGLRGEIKKLSSIPGSPPKLLNPPLGCRFAPRCPIAKSVCRREEPFLIRTSNENYTRCHFALDDKLLEDVKFEEG